MDEKNRPDLIDDQTAPAVCDIPWGKRGNTADNGCGWIAAYNVTAALLGHVRREDVTGEIVRLGGVWFSGRFGTKPRGITRYLRSRFGKVKTAGPFLGRWRKKSRGARAVIALFQHKGLFSPLHYVSGIGEEPGKFRFYNDDDYSAEYGGEPVTADEFCKLMKKEGRKPIKLWAVTKD